MMLEHVCVMFLQLTSENCQVSTGQDADKCGVDGCSHGGSRAGNHMVNKKVQADSLASRYFSSKVPVNVGFCCSALVTGTAPRAG